MNQHILSYEKRPQSTHQIVFSFICFTVLGCEKQNHTTVINGKVIDLETKQPIADATVELWISEGLSTADGYLNPEKLSIKSDAQGYYFFILPEYNSLKLHTLHPSKDKYVQDPSILGTVYSEQHGNPRNLHLAKGSQLVLKIKKGNLSSENSLSQIDLDYKIGDIDPPFSYMYNKQVIEFKTSQKDTLITRSFYFKKTPLVNVSWKVIVNGDERDFKQEVPLIEYKSVELDITY